MATYEYVDPSASQKDEIRFLLQDTQPDEWQLSDEEIAYAIAKWKDVWSTSEGIASVLADTLAARYAREATISADGVSISLSQVAQQYRDLATNLRAQHKGLLVGGSPDAGGISPYEERDPFIRNFSFGTGMHDDIEAGPQDYGDRGQGWYLPEYFPGA